MITQPNYLQKIFDSTGISGLASSAGSSISDYLKSFGAGPDVSNPSETGQQGQTETGTTNPDGSTSFDTPWYTPPVEQPPAYDYYSSPEYLDTVFGEDYQGR
jgi:hypothetical protein